MGSEEQLARFKSEAAHRRALGRAKVRVAKGEVAKAKADLYRAHLGLKDIRAQNAIDEADADLRLAQAGLKRQFLTGRIVNVHRSRIGHVPHLRRAPRGRKA